MSKHKKTLKEKMLAEKRRQDFFSSPTTPQTISLPNLDTIITRQPIRSQASYEYVKHDLLKTLIVTAAILALQIILFLFSKTHPLYKVF